MKIAYLDCFSGMSGDMFLGALVDAGVSAGLLEQTVAALDIGARLEISRVNRSGITATKVDVFVHGEKELPREEFWAAGEKGQAQSHGHEGSHGHSHGEARAHRVLIRRNFRRQECPLHIRTSMLISMSIRTDEG
jgi:uncharacterized protein (DUF111 family)